ncbi:MAG TPA: GDP-L-fucose synthase [Solirubrobacteraceae bacterium]|nr:GDP-L-fucose synthase [Solirubrobacteraceae bacterium]
MSEASSRAYWSGQVVAVTGGAGFVGGALVRDLKSLGAEVKVVRSAQYDLRDARATREAVDGAQIVIHLAANVGGIGFNRRNPAPLVYDNVMMAGNIFEQSRQAGVEKLISACTVCAYPKFTPTPFREDELWNGYPEETNAPYGLAKKMMLVLSDSYRRQYGFNSVVPLVVNLYGPGDHFSLEDSHVIPAMVRKFHEATAAREPRVVMWGSGSPSREFLYVDDASRALLLAGEHLETSDPVNVGTGVETRIRDLAEMIGRYTGYEGETVWDISKPDGQPTRCLDVSRARELMGFEAQVGLEEGLQKTVRWFQESLGEGELSQVAAQSSGGRV